MIMKPIQIYFTSENCIGKDEQDNNIACMVGALTHKIKYSKEWSEAKYISYFELYGVSGILAECKGGFARVKIIVPWNPDHILYLCNDCALRKIKQLSDRTIIQYW